MAGGPWAVTAAELVAWVGAQSWARETRRSVYASLRSFWGWGVSSGYVAVSPAAQLPPVRPSEPVPRPVGEGDYRAAVVDADRRTRLILRLAGEAGLRRAEISQVHRRDLVQDLLGWSLLVHGKGGRDRLVPLPDGLAADLRPTIGWLLPGDDAGHLSPRWVGKLAVRALPEPWTLHTLRHRFATVAYRETQDLMAVQRLLGHTSPATTQRYVATGVEQLRRAVAAAAA